MNSFNNPISEGDAKFVKSFVDFVNGEMSSEKNIILELANAHRYLQQQIFDLFISFMKELAYNYKNRRYDARNERAACLSAEAYQRLIECDLIYDPEFPTSK